MEYAEKRQVVIRSAAYKRLIRLFAVVFGLFGIANCVLVIRWYAESPELFPGGTRFLIFSLGYWSAGAAVLFATSLLVLRFVVPAVMNDAQIGKLDERGLA